MKCSISAHLLNLQDVLLKPGAKWHGCGWPPDGLGCRWEVRAGPATAERHGVVPVHDAHSDRWRSGCSSRFLSWRRGAGPLRCRQATAELVAINARRFHSQFHVPMPDARASRRLMLARSLRRLIIAMHCEYRCGAYSFAAPFHFSSCGLNTVYDAGDL